MAKKTKTNVVEIKQRYDKQAKASAINGHSMKAIRLSLGLTLEELSEVVGFGNAGSLSDMENGNPRCKCVSPRMQLALRDLLKIATNGGGVS